MAESSETSGSHCQMEEQTQHPREEHLFLVNSANYCLEHFVASLPGSPHRWNWSS